MCLTPSYLPQMTAVRLTLHQSSSCVWLTVAPLILCLPGRAAQILEVGGFSSTENFIPPYGTPFDALRSLIGNQYVSSFLQNPYYFMYASLAQPDEDVEIHWFNVRVSFFGCKCHQCLTIASSGRKDKVHRRICGFVPVSPQGLRESRGRCCLFRIPRSQCENGRELPSQTFLV